MNKPVISLKRAYDPASPDDGYRVYIDRLWPRGLSHETFHYDLWDKDIAPSTELREWFHADPVARWSEFKQRYGAELDGSTAFASLVSEIRNHPKVTLLYSSRDHEHNNAVVVAEKLKNY
ncbi:MAG: DUF488 family protein [Clostridium sp.]|nr:DUF488 family protein [Clostridium sp.]